MKLDELDESQGLTADMVREWLSAQNRSQLIGDVWTWRDGQLRDANLHHSLSFSLAALCAIGNKRPQQLLREINPRMRKGMPSRAALEAHGENGDWVVFRNVLHAVRFVWTVCDVVQMVSGFDVFRSDNPEDAAMIAECSFWPCDKHGNKVRWPTDAEGKML